MIMINDWHPDVEEFITCKSDEEKKAWALIDAYPDQDPLDLNFVDLHAMTLPYDAAAFPERTWRTAALLMAAGLDAVIHLGRDPSGARVVSGVHVLRREADGYVRTVPALTRVGTVLQRADGIDHLEGRLANG